MCSIESELPICSQRADLDAFLDERTPGAAHQTALQQVVQTQKPEYFWISWAG